MEELELRNSIRRLVAVDVVVDYAGLGLVRGRACDLSVGGMRVDTGPVLLPVDAVVSLSFSTGSGRLHRVDARVVHNGDGALGLEFVSLSKRSEEAICALLQSASQEGKAA